MAQSRGYCQAAPLCIGQTHSLQSTILNEERKLNVYLPTDYSSEKKYGIIYLLDGSYDEDFIHIAGLMQFFYMMYQMDDFILVGIGNIDRKRDFTFATDVKELKEKYPTTGGSAKFIQFIEKELQPYIEQTFHTNTTRFLIGQSLGGLLAAEILIKKPELFTHYLIVSPSLWWDNHSLLKEAAQVNTLSYKQPQCIYLAVGGKEEKDMRQSAKKLNSILKSKSMASQKFDFKELKTEDHATILHQAIIEGFKKIFPPRY